MRVIQTCGRRKAYLCRKDGDSKNRLEIFYRNGNKVSAAVGLGLSIRRKAAAGK